MLELEVLVGKLLAVDGLATPAVAAGKVTALAHEVADNTVEVRALVAKALLAGAERAEVLGRLGDDVSAEGHLDAAHGGAIAGHIEENDGVGSHD